MKNALQFNAGHFYIKQLKLRELSLVMNNEKWQAPSCH
jgi:hypothetical protein